MRITNTCVLALVLFGSAGVWGQAAKEPPLQPPAPGAAITPPNAGRPTVTSALDDDAPGGAASPPTTAAIDRSAVTSALDDGPLGLDAPIPPNCVPQLFWLRADYLVWFIRREAPPAIISVLPDSLATSTVAVPGNALTTVYPINNNLNFKAFNGVRLNTGIWLDSSRTIGIDVSGFVTDQNSNNGTYASSGSPAFSRNYISTNTGLNSFIEFANPDPKTGYSGVVSASSTVSSIHSGDINIRWNGYRFLADNADWLFGFRYFNFREQLNINGTINTRPQININDRFSTTNNFYGAQVGLNSRLCGWGGFSVDGIIKVAAGDMAQTVNIQGSNTLTFPNGRTSTQPGGLYAQPSNIGTFHKDKFSVIPDLTINLNYNITQRAAVFVGYNYIYASNIMRAGNAIDPHVNDSSLRYLAMPPVSTGTVAPAPIFREQGVWLQGVNVGLRVQY